MMDGISVVFPFALCQSIVKNTEQQLCHVCEASVSFNGTKANASLQAHVVATETEKMVELVVSFSPVSAKDRSETEIEILQFVIEDLQKVLESDRASRLQSRNERLQRETCTPSKVKPKADDAQTSASCQTVLADQYVSGDKYVSKNVRNRVSLFLEKDGLNLTECTTKPEAQDSTTKLATWSDTQTCTETQKINAVVGVPVDTKKLEKFQLSTDSSNADHEYSLCGCNERIMHDKEMSPCLQLVYTSEKNEKKKYDALIRKCKKSETDSALTATWGNMSQAHVPGVDEPLAEAHHSQAQSCPSPSVVLEGKQHIVSENVLQNNSSSERKKNASDAKNNDISANESAAQELRTPSNKRFVRKYDRLIKNLEMASKRSGLEMMSVLSEHSQCHKLNLDAVYDGMNITVADSNVQKVCSTSSSSTERPRGRNATSSQNKIPGCLTQRKTPADSKLGPDDKLKSSIAASTRAEAKATVNIFKPHSSGFQTTLSLKSFPRKFPSSLIRTDNDMVDVLVSNTSLRKRSMESAGLNTEGTVSKLKKSDDTGRLTSSAFEAKETGNMTVLAGKVQIASHPVNKGEPACQSAGCVRASSRRPVHPPLRAASAAAADHRTPIQGVMMNPVWCVADNPTSLVTGHQPPTPSSDESHRTDHDYTDLVYDKKAPSCRALKTLVKPISLTRHIKARVERVEEGQGSSLVTISGLNKKAAAAGGGGRGGGTPLAPITPTWEMSKEGLPIVETLEDAMTDTIRRHQRLRDSYQLALEAPVCQPVFVSASSLPVVSEVLVSHKSQRSLDHKSRRINRRQRSLQHKPRRPRKTAVFQGTAHTSLPVEWSSEVAVTDDHLTTLSMDHLTTLSMDHWQQGVIACRFQPGEEIVVESGPCGQSEIDAMVACMNGATALGTMLRRESDTRPFDSRKKGLYAVFSDHEQSLVSTKDVLIEREETLNGHEQASVSTEQHMLIENEREARTSDHMRTEDVLIENDREVTTSGLAASQRVCMYCLRLFQAPVMLYKHVKTVHAAYTDQCPRYSGYLQDLKAACQVECPLCPQSCLLSNQYHLHTHLTTRHPSHPHHLLHYTSPLPSPHAHCDVCQVHFHTAAELTVHTTLQHSE